MSRFPLAVLAPFAELYAENPHLHSCDSVLPVFGINNTQILTGDCRAAAIVMDPMQTVFVVSRVNRAAEDWALRELPQRPRRRIVVMRVGSAGDGLYHIRGLRWPVVFVYGSIPEHVREELLALRAYLVQVNP